MEKLALICVGAAIIAISITAGVYAIRTAVKFFKEEH